MEDVIGWASLANVFAVAGQIGYGVDRGGRLDELLVEHLQSYAWTTGLLTILCCTWVVFRLRVAVLQPDAGSGARTAGEARAGRRLRLGFGVHPAVWTRPILWKEVFVDSGVRSGLLGRFVIDQIHMIREPPGHFAAYWVVTARVAPRLIVRRIMDVVFYIVTLVILVRPRVRLALQRPQN